MLMCIQRTAYHVGSYIPMLFLIVWSLRPMNKWVELRSHFYIVIRIIIMFFTSWHSLDDKQIARVKGSNTTLVSASQT